MNNLKKKIKSGELLVGGWITLYHPAIAEIFANANFDWITVDLEHSVISMSEAEELIRIIELKDFQRYLIPSYPQMINL